MTPSTRSSPPQRSLEELRRFALSLSQTPHDADDLVQAAVERALRHASTWQPGTAMDSWMYKIVQNLWRDELRAHRRRAEPLDESNDVMGEDGREVNLNRIQWAEARAAMQELPEDQRLVLTLVVLDGLSYQQAADTLEVPIGTVMSRLSRARAQSSWRICQVARSPSSSAASCRRAISRSTLARLASADRASMIGPCRSPLRSGRATVTRAETMSPNAGSRR